MNDAELRMAVQVQQASSPPPPWTDEQVAGMRTHFQTTATAGRRAA